MSTYPAGIKAWTRLADTTDDVLAADVNTLYSEVTAIQTELGIDPAGVYATVVARLDALDATDYLNVGKTRRVFIAAAYPDPSNPPDVGTITKDSLVVPVLYFDPDTNEKIHWSWYVPPDCDTTKNVTVAVDALLPDTTNSSSAVSLKLAYTSRADNELVNSSVNTKTATQATSSFTAANYRNLITTLFISQSFTAAGDTVSCTLIRDATNASDNYTSDFGIYNLSLEYTNKDPA